MSDHKAALSSCHGSGRCALSQLLTWYGLCKPGSWHGLVF